ncbi:MAG: hypothetical protein N3E40_00785 [Dehalococcoidia bacterium]|nr:hypothetical protein [Dehalococcoidia bacterium]
MEQALFISRSDRLRYWSKEFSCLYFGNEFCERLLPTPEELTEVLKFVFDNRIQFTLVTPYVTEAGIGHVEALLDTLAGCRPGSEVVFNDYGVLRMLGRQFPSLTPVMGRLLNKMKRGPRLMVVIDRLPETTVEYFRNSSLTAPLLQKFLKERGVRRVELDNLLQGIDLPLRGWEMSLYLPYAYVTTTRLCLTASCDIPEMEERIGIFPCQRECRKYTFALTSEIMPVTLIRKGNTIFFENPVLPENFEGSGISRLVFQPEIPM